MCRTVSSRILIGLLLYDVTDVRRRRSSDGKMQEGKKREKYKIRRQSDGEMKRRNTESSSEVRESRVY